MTGDREAMRRALRARLAAHRPADAREAGAQRATLAFLDSERDPFSRDTRSGHITGSAVVLDATGRRVLLVRHRKLGRWLQPGGHTHSGDASVLDTAVRETREETGVDAPDAPLGDEVLHVDVHEIPARGAEPAHLHYDVRYLLIVPDADPPAANAGDGVEVSAAGWFGVGDLDALGLDDSLRSALARATVVLGARRRPGA